MKKQVPSDKYYRFYNSIRFKYMASLLVSACLCLVGLLSYNYFSLQRVIKENANQRADEITQHIESATNSYLRYVIKMAEMLEVTFRSNKLTEEEVELNMKNLLLDAYSIYACQVGFEPRMFDEAPFTMMVQHDHDPNAASHAKVSVGHERLNTDDYMRAIYGGKAFFSSPYNEVYFDSIAVISYVLPILEEGVGEVKGAVKIYLSVEWFNEWITKMLQYSDGFIAILDSNADLIADTDATINGKSLRIVADEMNMPQLEEIERRIKNKESESKEPFFVTLGDGRWVGLQPLLYADWNVMIILNNELLFRGADTLYANLIKIGIIGVILMFFVIYTIISRITNPLSRLADSTNRIARGDFDVQIPVNRGKDEVGRLTHSMQAMISRLKILFNEMREKERLEGELSVARDIQKTILPRTYPAFSQLHSVDVYGEVRQAKQVGGDFFDYLLYKERYLIFAIGDVSGNGVPASLLMAVARTLFRANISFNTGEIASKMNKELCLGNETNMFVSMFIGILDSQTGTLRYTNAGHSYPFLKKADGSLVELRQTHGIPLGVLDALIYRSEKMQLSPNQTIVLYTDGIIEARSRESQFLGVERVKEYLETLSPLENAMDISSGLIRCVQDYTAGCDEFVDDITVLSIKFMGNDPLSVEIENNMGGIRVFQEKFFRYCFAHNMEEAFSLKVNLAIEELLVNIVFHASVSGENQMICLHLSRDENGIRITIKDDGSPFDITKAFGSGAAKPDNRQIGGWGLFLVQHTMDEIEYVRLNNSNIVFLYKKYGQS